MNISTGFTGADGGYYHVTLDYEKVFQSKDRYQCDMFAAELKGRLSAASREKELLAKLEYAEKVLSSIAMETEEDENAPFDEDLIGSPQSVAVRALKAIRE